MEILLDCAIELSYLPLHYQIAAGIQNPELLPIINKIIVIKL